jgi:hypothetical protein
VPPQACPIYVGRRLSPSQQRSIHACADVHDEYNTQSQASRPRRGGTGRWHLLYIGVLVLLKILINVVYLITNYPSFVERVYHNHTFQVTYFLGTESFTQLQIRKTNSATRFFSQTCPPPATSLRVCSKK